jgi:hypothetical protein
MRKLFVLGGIVSVAGIAAAAYGIRRRRQQQAAKEAMGPAQGVEEAVLVIVDDLEPEIVVIAEPAR